jgi:hypothetical protein
MLEPSFCIRVTAVQRKIDFYVGILKKYCKPKSELGISLVKSGSLDSGTIFSLGVKLKYCKSLAKSAGSENLILKRPIFNRKKGFANLNLGLF